MDAAKATKHLQPRSKACHEKSAEAMVPRWLQTPGEGLNSRRCQFQMETGHGTKYRQLHIEDYLQEIPAEQGKATGVYAHEWTIGNIGTTLTKTIMVDRLGYPSVSAHYLKVCVNY